MKVVKFRNLDGQHGNYPALCKHKQEPDFRYNVPQLQVHPASVATSASLSPSIFARVVPRRSFRVHREFDLPERASCANRCCKEPESRAWIG